MKNAFILCGLLASTVSAHIQMSKPYPLRSPLNKDSKGKKDYSYTNPLSTDGSDYPCKGYADDDFEATADYTPGNTYDLELKGSATHKGGSCQISLSYDKGKTFNVIHSIIGGCPLDKSYKFDIPSSAPSGEALLAWTWFNKVGNREMYMNCAQVNVGDGGDSGNATEHSGNAEAESFDSLPPVFIANVGGPGDCETVEGKDVNFPKPGPSVEGSGEGEGYKCKGDADFLGGSSSKSEDSTSTSEPKANVPQSDSILENHAPAETAPAKKHATAFGTPPDWNSKNTNADDGKDAEAKEHAKNDDNAGPQGKPEGSGGPPQGKPEGSGGPPQGKPQGSGGPPQGKPQGSGGPPQGKPEGSGGPPKGEHHLAPGSIICHPDGKSFSRCTANGPPINMGAVAAGTTCRDGAIIPL